MATVSSKGKVTFIREIKNGVRIGILEPKPNKFAKAVFFNCVAFGKKAQAILSKVEKGHYLQVTTDISHRRVGDKTYTNYTIIAWQLIDAPQWQPRKPQEERDGDWFVPSTNSSKQSPYSRRHEGFVGGGR